MFMRKAFTLAEVLITLGIIGVVAALLIPSTVENLQKRVVLNQYKAFYRDFTNAVDMFMQDNNISSFSETPLGNAELSLDERKTYFINNFLKKYLSGSDGEFQTIREKYMTNSAIHNIKPDYITTKGVAVQFDDSMWDSLFTVYFDVNGKKGPNKVGTDTFRFYFYPQKSVPQGAYQKVKDWDCSNCGDCCRPDLRPDASGWGCWQRIIQDSWQINY